MAIEYTFTGKTNPQDWTVKEAGAPVSKAEIKIANDTNEVSFSHTTRAILGVVVPTNTEDLTLNLAGGGTVVIPGAAVAAIFAPVFSVLSVSILLVLISIYDAYAVWKSKHMITLAKSQAKANVFAGLMIPYTEKGIVHKKSKKRRGPPKGGSFGPTVGGF